MHGGNSQYEAIARHPELFENVACMCSPMVVSMSAIFDAFSELQGGSAVPGAHRPRTAQDGRVRRGRDDAAPPPWTRKPEEGQKTFDLLGSSDKELFWIEGTTKRFRDGYNHFGRHPEKVLTFFEKHLS